MRRRVKDLPGWVRWLLVGRFVNALGSMAWVFIPLYLVSDRGLSEGAAGRSRPSGAWA